MFFFNDTATTEIYTLSLHDALPILAVGGRPVVVDEGLDGNADLVVGQDAGAAEADAGATRADRHRRSEEHTSELQSRQYLVCRLLLEKKNRATVHSAIISPLSMTST